MARTDDILYTGLGFAVAGLGLIFLLKPASAQQPTPTPTPTSTFTPSPTPTQTFSPTPTPTQTQTPSPTPSPTPTQTQTPTPTMSPTPPPTGYAIPQGFTRVRDFNTNFRWWGRYTTNYASGGSGPSLRWDNPDVNWLNMVGGFDFRIGPVHGVRGDDEVSLKFPRCIEPEGERGVYDPNIEWFVDGRNSLGRAGKERPHPTTFLGSFNVDNPRPQIGNIKDGQWHSFLAAVYNDPINNYAPTQAVWYNPSPTHRIEDYIYLGKSQDWSPLLMPLPPPLPYASLNHSGGTHPMQLRIDEIPASEADRLGPNEWVNIAVANMYATEANPPGW